MSSSSVSSHGERGIPTKCNCGLGVKIFTSKTQENPGRPFFRCTSKRDVLSWSSNRDDHLFKWIEDALFEELVDALIKLANIKRETSKWKAESKEFKVVIEEMKQELIQTKKEIRKSNFYLKFCVFCLFLVTIVAVFDLV